MNMLVLRMRTKFLEQTDLCNLLFECSFQLRVLLREGAVSKTKGTLLLRSLEAGNNDAIEPSIKLIKETLAAQRIRPLKTFVNLTE